MCAHQCACAGWSVGVAGGCGLQAPLLPSPPLSLSTAPGPAQEGAGRADSRPGLPGCLNHPGPAGKSVSLGPAFSFNITSALLLVIRHSLWDHGHVDGSHHIRNVPRLCLSAMSLFILFDPPFLFPFTFFWFRLTNFFCSFLSPFLACCL